MIDESLSLLAAAREVPEQTALVVEGQAYTFAELAPQVRRRMEFLLAQPLRQAPWPRVALCADNRLETALWLYALLELSVTAVLLHPRLVAGERQELLADCQPALLLDARCEAALAEPEKPRPLERERENETDSDGRLAMGPLAILYTSGTTGRPKGAMLSRRAFLAAAQASACNLGWQADDRWLLCMPLSHVGGLSILTRCLIARRTVVLVGGGFTPQTIAQVVDRDRVTLVSLVPTMLRRLLELAPAWTAPPRLRAVLLGGAAASEGLLTQAAERGVPVLTTYGLTEACSQATTQRYGTRPAAEQGAGEPIAGLELRISAADDQIELRSPTLFDGYWPPRPGALPLTADGWFRTGDLGRVDLQGRLHVLARRTDLIVTGGENVYPAEVEQALERCPAVAAACVVGLPDPEWGQVVAAALVARTAPLTVAALRTELREQLAAYKHPRQLVWLPALPLSATGKVDRAAVKQQLQATLSTDLDVPPRR